MNTTATLYPNYSAFQTLIGHSTTSATTATAPANGWIFVRMQLDNNTDRTISINNKEIISVRSGAEYLNGNECGGAYPVKQGASITAVRATVYFAPMA